MKWSWLLAACAVALAPASGCQSIANVQDVTFAPSASDCSAYCTTLKKACPGDVGLYPDDATCLQACSLFKAGSPSKPMGNTLSCRSAQATQALRANSDLNENRTQCAAAGPGGDAVCTSYPDTPDCEGYCNVYMAACTKTEDWGFDNFDQCRARCAAFPWPRSYRVGDGQNGDTLACRLYHATLALTDPDNNCPSAGLRPTADCLGSGEANCDDYCRVNSVACTGEYRVYETTPQCKAVCEATRKGTRMDTGGQDTIGCRWYHSYFALMGQPTPHCSHSGPAGDGVCSDEGEKHPNCTAFCRLFEKACSERFASVYGSSADTCVEECEKLDDAKVVGGNLYGIDRAQSGNTLKCRTLNVVRALTAPQSVDAPGYCEAALGGDPCR